MVEGPVEELEIWDNIPVIKLGSGLGLTAMHSQDPSRPGVLAFLESAGTQYA